MAIFNLNDQKANSDFLNRNYDYIIVGCGIVGTFSALELSSKDKKVLVIESGRYEENDEKQALNNALLNRKDLEGSIHWGRKRALGGTGIAWGGQALRFSKVDFNNQLNNHARWLLEMNDIDQGYLAAEKFLNIGRKDYSDLSRFNKVHQIKFNHFHIHLSKWSREPNRFKAFKRKITRKCDILYNAHCTLINKTENKFNSIIITNDKLVKYEIFGENLIFANGGVESVRSLLLNFSHASDFIGKGFMEHPCLKVADIRFSNSELLQELFGVKFSAFYKYGIRICASDEYLTSSNKLNASFSLMFESPDDSFDVFREARKGFTLNGLAKILRNMSEIIKVLQFLLLKKTIFRSNAKASLVIMAEQEWDEKSILSLDNSQKDVYQQPKLKLDWNISDRTLSDMKFNSLLILEELSKKIPGIEFENIKVLESNLREKVTPVNHHMGGASMGVVVDGNLKLYGYTNVFVYSSAVFPSSSHSNPTLTTLALVYRSIQKTCAA